MVSLNFYLFSEKIACSGCVGKIETAIKKVDCNAEVNLRNISTHESRVNIETRYPDFKERFNRLHGEAWVLCDTLDEYSIQKKAARYNVFFVFMVLVLGVWVAFFQPFLPVYDILICSSVFIYSSVALRVFSGQFDHGLLLAVLSMVLFVMTLVANVHGYLLGGMLCIEHFACPIFILASLSLRSFFSIVADSKMDEPKELDFLKYKKEGNDVAINEISEGDVISIRPGQLIPFDGLIKSPGDYVFNTVSTNGDTASTVSQGGNVSCGWVYSSCDRGVEIKALKVKGGVKSKDYKAKVAAVRKKRSHEKDRRSLLFLLVNLTLCFVPPISCLFLFYSFGFTSFLHMAMNLLMVFCPCSMFLARFYVGGMVANNLHRDHKDLGVRVQGLSGFGSLASKKLVFCWDRTNTLTNPSSTKASVLREDVRGVIKKLIAMGCTKHYVLSGNKGDENVESLFGKRNVFFGCKSEGKHEKILELQAKGYTVAMIGDGENDLLALAQADVSFGVWHSVIGYGSSLPVVTSDIVLNNNISGLPYLVAAARSSESFLNWLALFNGASAVAVAVCVVQGVVTNPIIVSSYMLGMMVLNIFLSFCYRSFGVGDVVLSSSRQDKLSSDSISHDVSLGVSNVIDLGLKYPKEKVI